MDGQEQIRRAQRPMFDPMKACVPERLAVSAREAKCVARRAVAKLVSGAAHRAAVERLVVVAGADSFVSEENHHE
jgi:hypothetical protein